MHHSVPLPCYIFPNEVLYNVQVGLHVFCHYIESVMYHTYIFRYILRTVHSIVTLVWQFLSASSYGWVS